MARREFERRRYTFVADLPFRLQQKDRFVVLPRFSSNRSQSGVPHLHPKRPRLAPADLVPFLTAPRPPRRCSPDVLAVALARLHREGVRKRFVLIVPGKAGRRAPRWADLCQRIRSETRLSVVIVATPAMEQALRMTGLRTRRRLRIISDLSPPERTGLAQLAQGVCTGSRKLAIEAGALGTPALNPRQLEATRKGSGQLEDLLLESRYRQILAETAA